jgi:hypothetical protein
MGIGSTALRKNYICSRDIPSMATSFVKYYDAIKQQFTSLGQHVLSEPSSELGLSPDFFFRKVGRRPCVVSRTLLATFHRVFYSRCLADNFRAPLVGPESQRLMQTPPGLWLEALQICIFSSCNVLRNKLLKIFCCFLY